MQSDDRRKKLADILLSSDKPVPGAELSERLCVSRQIIVSDIAKLRLTGFGIISTHTGYIMASSPYKERIFKVRHTGDETVEELTGIVERGGTVVDVCVRHKIYGKISAPLNIFSLNRIEQFLESIKSGKSTELMHITSGYHYHTVRAETEAQLDEIDAFLKEKGFAVPETDPEI